MSFRTARHSITLGLAVLGVIHVPPAPVEAAIALSILVLAAGIVRRHRDGASSSERAPWVVAFVFGLLHGLGFAQALIETGLPPRDIPLALFTFNVGVELGQLAFIGAVQALRPWLAWSRRWLVYRQSRPLARWQARPACAAIIGSLAAYWLIDRVAGF